MQKEPILICLYAYFPFENAITNVMLPLIEKLSRSYEVHILTQNWNGCAPEYEVDERNVIIHRYAKDKGLRAWINKIGDVDRIKKRPWYKAVPVYILATLARSLQKFCRRSEYRALKKLVKENSFSLFITICGCFSAHKNMLLLKKDTGNTTPWVAYFVDPYSYYIENRGVVGELLQAEQQVYKSADLVLVTEEMYKENQHNLFAQYLDKTVPFKYGNFKCLRHALSNDIFDQSKINCVYVGSLLNERIRSPRYFYKMINILDDRFRFHIICNQISEDNKNLFETIVKKKGNVSWYYNLPLAECLGIMCHADILVNLGNKAINQTPSKVFDYIGTGKPIVNFHSLEEDTSKFYLERYPLKLNIFETENDLVTNAVRFGNFCDTYAGKAVSHETLQALYGEYNSEKVTNHTFNIIEHFLQTRRMSNV